MKRFWAEAARLCVKWYLVLMRSWGEIERGGLTTVTKTRHVDPFEA